MKPTIETFFVDIGNVLINYDTDRFNQKMAQLTGMPLIDMQKLNDRVILPIFHAIETGVEFPYYSYRHYRSALFDLLHTAGVVRFDRERVKREFTYMFFREAFGNIFTANFRMCHFVRDLRQSGSKIILVSNNNPIHYDYERQTAPQVFKNCDAFILSHEVGCRKPMPEIWSIAVDMSNTPPWNTFVIDDKSINIDSAKENGLSGAVFTNVSNLKKDLESFGFDF